MAVERDQVEDVYPLSPLQEGILYHCERNPESPAYWNQLSFRITGPLDVERLRRAWQAVLDRHPALRSSFVRDRRGAPRQVVRNSVSVAFEVVQAPTADEEAGDQWLAGWLAEDLLRRPSLRAAPLFRIAVIRYTANHHRMVWTVHHIVQDGWSSATLLQEVFRVYGGPQESEALPAVVPYRSYIEHLSARLAKGDRERFWTDYLADLPAAGALAGQVDTGSQVVTIVNRNLNGAPLQAAARRWGLTQSSLAQGAWALTLAAETGSSDVLFGVTVADRDPDLPQSDEIVGLMLATLPVRARTCEPQGIQDWLKTQQRSFSRQRDNLAPLADIQRWSGRRGGALFESLLVFENYPLPENVAAGTGLTVDDFNGFEQTNYPLTLTIAPGEEWRLTFSFLAECVEAAKAERMLARFAAVLQEIAASAADLPVGSVDWWLPGERVQAELTGPEEPAVHHVVALLSEQVSQHEDQVAVRFRDKAMSYGAFWRRSAEIALALEQAGLVPGDRIALCLQRCLDLPALMVGAWRAGVAFVPLDPDFPAERLRFIVEDAQVRLVVADASTKALDLGAVARIHLDELAGQPAERAYVPAPDTLASRLDDAASRWDDSAYLIYTSGSTGRPKGVLVPHGAFANLLLGFRSQLGLGAEDRFLAVTTISFDISLLELLLPLITGSELDVLPADAARDGDAIARRLEDATVMQATPATWRLLLDTGWMPEPGVRKVLLSGGERLPPDLAQQLLARSTEVWNLYGPTETTIWSTASRLEGCSEALPEVHIGQPILNTRCLIIDDAGRVLPRGVTGELVIGGRGVASGYWNPPELTNEKFSLEEGVRYYRTGDRARVRADGMLDCFGRNDDQVKLRGFRIELGEIDAVLMRHPQVSGACTIVQNPTEAVSRLVAYVVCAPQVPDSALLEIANSALPAYMVPSRIQRLDELPLTPNLKVDRAALAAQTLDERPVIAHPVGELEEALATQWTALLGIDRIGRDDSFFASGGDSLLLAKLYRRLTLAYAEIPAFAAFIAAQTIREQAALIAPAAERAELPALERADDRSVFPATPFQSRLWMLEQFEDARGAHNVFGAFECRMLNDDLDLDAELRSALEKLAERHEILRTVLRFAEGRVEQGVLPSATVDLAASVLDEQDLEEALARLGSSRFDLDSAPPWRVRTFYLPERIVVGICLHHALVDGLSLDSLLGDLDAFIHGAEPASTPVQFGDFARWRDALPPPLTAQARDYWRERLSGELPVLNLPLFRSRPPLQDFSGEVCARELPPQLTSELIAAAAALGVSLNTLLLSGYAMLLLRYTAEPEVMIGLAATDRMLVDAAGAIGPYVNVLPLLVEQPDSVLGLVQGVRGSLNDALANSVLPFEEMIELLDVPRDLSRTPIYQTLFSFIEEDPPALDAGAATGRLLELVPLPVPSRTARTDLGCFITRRAGRLMVQLEYATALLEPWLLEQMLDHLERLYRAICDLTCHDKPVDSIELTTTAERGELVTLGQPEWQPVAGESVDGLIDWLGLANRVAVQDADHCWTYEQLDAAAWSIARGLTSKGVQPGACVAVSVSRSVHLVAVLLGVWRAGCHYLALDSELPAKRLAFMLEDSECQVLLTDDPAQTDADLRIIEVGSLLAEAASDTALPLQQGKMAYLIYTSGSTGQPKGVLVGQRQVANFLLSMKAAPGFAAEDRLLACTTLSFDIAVLELFLPLVCGGRLYVGSASLAADPKALASLLEEASISVFQATPSAWRGLVQTDWQAPERLRAFVGGEAMSQDLQSELQLRCASVWNLYGPTETTIWSMAADVSRLEGPPLLGEAVRNTRIYLVDRHDRPVPAGIQGELLIGGDGVAEGYWRREALSRQRFVADPFVPGARLFRTGDLARRSPSGEVLFLGRADQQVKLRGFRIELEEVAQQVRNHPDVLDACALVVEIEQGDERLVAYLACADPEAFDRPGLMRELRRSLPGYMVPQHIMLLEALPKTPNGKLDRNALPSPKPTAAHFESPASETENRLAELWGSVLQVPRVSRQDRFFDIGGHSLSAIQVSLELERTLGVDVSPNLLVMENLAGVAAELDRLLAERSPAASVAVETEASRDDNLGRHGMLARVWARLRQSAGG